MSKPKFHFDHECPDVEFASDPDSDNGVAWFEHHAKTCKQCKAFNKDRGPHERRLERAMEKLMNAFFEEVKRK